LVNPERKLLQIIKFLPLSQDTRADMQRNKKDLTMKKGKPLCEES
jgi:hypothetical protein